MTKILVTAKFRKTAVCEFGRWVESGLNTGDIAKWPRRRSAKPLFPGSNPGVASRKTRNGREFKTGTPCRFVSPGGFDNRMLTSGRAALHYCRKPSPSGEMGNLGDTWCLEPVRGYASGSFFVFAGGDKYLSAAGRPFGRPAMRAALGVPGGVAGGGVARDIAAMCSAHL